MTASWVKETQESLYQIRHYLKSDFKIHISLENQCADHCLTYALSDSTLEFKKKSFHKHNMTCDRCDMSKDTLSAIRTAVSSKNVTMRIGQNIFPFVRQDWFSVAWIIENVLSNLKESYPEISEAFLRSDNAACYHCDPLMLSIPGISKRTGIEIRRYNFSDAQSGKDICDRRIACAKSHIRRFLNERNNITTASDMKKALDSYGGVKGYRTFVVSIDRTKQQIAKHKSTGITLINNFEFLEPGIN
ncbi:hypothetical protein AC249_AIPGENE26556 [Paramuricea clavata]|uniref:Uncharacterized protein n=1 Tax=Paramuricea clavata TaxID=317549 RepID=A0A6S7GL10_PARCT|nr:hypothetical protein AC249_AIPGENE26556 [Paramuricea clavata]